MQNRKRQIRQKPPLTEDALRELAISYVGRYASSRAKLAQYLGRKLRERGWEGAQSPPVEAIVERCASLGYIDDAAFAAMKARDLTQRGYGARRVDQALYGAGIGKEDGREARAIAEDAATASALAFARRRRFGPYAADKCSDPKLHQKQFAAMMRAGHAPDIIRTILDMEPGTADLPDRFC